MKSSAKLLLLLTLLCVLFFQCHRKNGSATSRDSDCPKEPEYNGYTITLNDSIGAEQIKSEILTKLRIELKEENFYVCPCDPTLAYLQHDSLVIEGHGPVQVKTGTVAFGLGIDYAKNYILDTDRSALSREVIGQFLKNLGADEKEQSPTKANPFRSTTQETANATPPNVIAIFDGGIHPDFGSLGHSTLLGIDGNTGLCSPQIDIPLSPAGRLNGVNHISEDGSSSLDYQAIWDNSDTQHGTKVSYLAASQRVGQAGANPVRILTMRVLNQNNKGDLFSLMCAMAQAKKLGATVFNMSLGYYGPENTLLRDHLQRLQTDKIWVVAAAGNAIDAYDVGATNLPRNRDLILRPDERKFYPATFAYTMKHVIAVTSVNNAPDTVCESQNYGKDIVDIGVMGDDCGFAFNAGGSVVYIKGTSYATPVVSGWIATKSNLSMFPDKKALLDDAPVAAPLIDQIKRGKYIKTN